jgi:hypothetical protein
MARTPTTIYLRVNGSGTMQTTEDMDRARRVAEGS